MRSHRIFSSFSTSLRLIVSIRLTPCSFVGAKSASARDAPPGIPRPLPCASSPSPARFAGPGLGSRHAGAGKGNSPDLQLFLHVVEIDRQHTAHALLLRRCKVRFCSGRPSGHPSPAPLRLLSQSGPLRWARPGVPPCRSRERKFTGSSALSPRR